MVRDAREEDASSSVVGVHHQPLHHFWDICPYMGIIWKIYYSGLESFYELMVFFILIIEKLLFKTNSSSEYIR